ncbi:MAG: ferrous iron transport protein B [Deltaproteobacteria bacterium]|nr:ferrous iron transport protein B [Deltaproteobacteria bacterium]
MSSAVLRIALFGNPNCGKTSLFNALTGHRQRVGNYAGVTVERRSGTVRLGQRTVEVIDLPGSYGLTNQSPEALIAQRELREGEIDALVFVVDATLLRQSLVHFSAMADLALPMVLCLNMADQAQASGQELDLGQLERELGVPVIETVGHRRLGVEQLKNALLRATAPRSVGQDIAAILARALRTPAQRSVFAASQRIDRIVAHRIYGWPIFLLLMYGIFWLAFAVGEIPMGWIEAGIARLSATIAAHWSVATLPQLRSLILDGVIAGVGGVLVFVPNIVLLFLALALLEDSGYLARASYLLDAVMQRFGLPGKGFIPLVTGFGCSVPGIMATRLLEDERDRKLTMFVLPLMSCGARLPIWMLLVPAFFPRQWQATALFGIYSLGIALALLLPRLLRRTLLKGPPSELLMVLPPYRRPTLRQLSHKVSERAWLYLKKAGTVILAISIVMWFISSFPAQLPQRPAQESSIAQSGRQHQLARDRLANSFAGKLGRSIEPLFAPAGYDWRIVTALIGAFAAKEVFVSQMSIVYAIDGADEDNRPLREKLRARYGLPTALSLIVFLLIATPCMATLAMTRREAGSWRWALFQFFGLTALGYVLAVLTFQLSRIVLGG